MKNDNASKNIWSIERFTQIVDGEIKNFSENVLLKKINENSFSMENYHSFLKMIFHQTFTGPSTFALAGANCNTRHWKIRDYLIHHAGEEKGHWEWVLEDLANTGYSGGDVREELPPPACQQYISFNYYLAVTQPVARLGIAAVLEGIGATYAKISAEKIMKILNIKTSQLKFVFGHGDTDIGHSQDIIQVLGSSNLEVRHWMWLCNAAKMAGKLYYNMYEEVVK